MYKAIKISQLNDVNSLNSINNQNIRELFKSVSVVGTSTDNIINFDGRKYVATLEIDKNEILNIIKNKSFQIGETNSTYSELIEDGNWSYIVLSNLKNKQSTIKKSSLLTPTVNYYVEDSKRFQYPNPFDYNYFICKYYEIVVLMNFKNNNGEQIDIYEITNTSNINNGSHITLCGFASDKDEFVHTDSFLPYNINTLMSEFYPDLNENGFSKHSGILLFDVIDVHEETPTEMINNIVESRKEKIKYQIKIR